MILSKAVEYFFADIPVLLLSSEAFFESFYESSTACNQYGNSLLLNGGLFGLKISSVKIL